MTHFRRNGLTLLDALIATGLLAIVAQLLLPLLQLSRERSRNTQCLANLRQLASGALSHSETHEHLPAGGWSWEWVGDPMRGHGKDQPGGWIYNILPFVGQTAIHDYAAVEHPIERHVKLGFMVQQAPEGFHCASRRTAGPHGGSPFDQVHSTKNADHAYHCARSDYAINGGNIYTTLWPGPQSYEHAASDDYTWPTDFEVANGLGYCRSTVRPQDISRGLSETYLIGEKYLNPTHYDNGLDAGDDFTMYQGDDMDIVRWTSPTITHAYRELIDFPNMPRRDDALYFSAYAFGSAHRKAWNAVFCDGSGRHVSYDLDPQVHNASGNRDAPNEETQATRTLAPKTQQDRSTP